MVIGLLRSWLDELVCPPRSQLPRISEAIVWGKNDVVPLGSHPDSGFGLVSVHAPPAYLLFRNGVNLLLMEGTRWQMGYQHGRLLWHMRDVDGVPLATRFAPGRRPDFSETPAVASARWPNSAEPWPEGDELPPIRFTRYVERILSEDIARDQLWLKKGAKRVVQQMYRLIWRTLAKNAPMDLLEAYYGVADGAGVGRDIAEHSVAGPDALIILCKTLYGAHTFESLADVLGHPLGCTSFVAWGKATADGGLIHARNLDFFPLVGVFDRYPLVQVFRHTGEPGQQTTDRWRVSVTAAGVHDIGVTAINEDGLVSGLHQNFSTEVGAGARFNNVTAFELSTRIIESATSLEDVRRILLGDSTNGPARRPSGAWTYVVSDAKEAAGNKAVVAEVTHGQVAIAEPCSSTPAEKPTTPRWSLVRPTVDGFLRFHNANEVPIMAQSNLHMDTQRLVPRDDRVLINRTMAVDVACRYVRAVQVAATDSPLTEQRAMRGLGDHHDPSTGNTRMLNRVIGNATTVASAVFVPKWDTAGKPQHRVWVAPNPAPSANGKFVEIPVSVLLERGKNLDQIVHQLPNTFVEIDPWEGEETEWDKTRIRILKEWYGEGYRRLLFGAAQAGVTDSIVGPRPNTPLEPRFLTERERIRRALPYFEEAMRRDHLEHTYPLTVACLAIRAYGLGEPVDNLARAEAALRAAWSRSGAHTTPYGRLTTQMNADGASPHEVRVLWLVQGWLSDLRGHYHAARQAYRHAWTYGDDTNPTPRGSKKIAAQSTNDGDGTTYLGKLLRNIPDITGFFRVQFDSTSDPAASTQLFSQPSGQHPFLSRNDQKLRSAARRYFVIPFRRVDAAELAYDPYLGDLMEYLAGQSFYWGNDRVSS